MNQYNFSKPQPLVDQIKHDLGMAIVKGDILPGQQLKEVELQKWFGVSRAPIREALRLLQGDGLVIVDNFKKRYVRRITKKDLEDLFPVMACLEGLAAGFAASVITPGTIYELQQVNVGIEKAYKEKQYHMCADLNFKFHSIFIKLVDNNALNRTIRSLTKGLIWLWMTNLYYDKNDLIPLSIAEHYNIISAFKKKNSEIAEKQVRNHIIKIFNRSLSYSIFDDEGDYVLSSTSNKL